MPATRPGVTTRAATEAAVTANNTAHIALSQVPQSSVEQPAPNAATTEVAASWDPLHALNHVLWMFAIKNGYSFV